MIGLIGINHHTARADLRSAFALSIAEASMLVEDWIACGLLEGAVILSTCNRVEIYYTIETDTPNSVEQTLIYSFLCNLELSPRYASLLETKRDKAVYEHLFRLSSGLESLVLGETQILGQIKEAYRMASLSGHCPGNLSRLFHRSFEVAKRIRSEYIVHATPLSAGSVAVDKLFALKETLGSVLIVGAGTMADTVYQHLFHHRHRDIVVYNRTRERAEKFARSHPEARIAYEGELLREISLADVIIVATGAPSPIIHAEDLDISSGKKMIVDLAVPRNVAPEVDELEHITLITLDELSDLGIQLGADKLLEVDRVIQEYVGLHHSWVEGAELREVICTIQQAMEQLLERELAGLPASLTDTDRQLIHYWDEHLKTSYSTAIVTALKELSSKGVKKYADAMHTVFKQILNKPE